MAGLPGFGGRNPFYIDPTGGADIGRSLARGFAMREHLDRREAREAATQRQQEAMQAIANAQGDPTKMYEVMNQYPELAEELRANMEWHDQQSAERHADDYRGLMNTGSVAEAIQIAQQRILDGEARGIDMSDTREDLARMQSGEWDLDAIKDYARLELMGTDKGMQYLKDRAELDRPEEAQSTIGKMMADRERLIAKNPNDPMIKRLDVAIAREAGIGGEDITQIDPALLEDLTPEVASKAAAAYTAAGGGKDGMKAYQDTLATARETASRRNLEANLAGMYPNATEQERAELQAVADAQPTAEKGMEAVQARREKQKKDRKSREQTAAAITLINEIRDNPVLNQVIGSIEGGERVFGVIPRTDAELDAINQIEQLEAMLTAENLDLLTGTISDADVAMLKALSAGGLRRKGSEKNFRRNLDKVQAALVPIGGTMRQPKTGRLFRKQADGTWVPVQ